VISSIAVPETAVTFGHDALGVTSDYLLDGATDEAAKARFEDRELLKQFREVEQLPDDKNVVKKLLDAFLTKKHLQALVR
jgi:hypothetical protein